jgi:hypothetical protein
MPRSPNDQNSFELQQPGEKHEMSCLNAFIRVNCDRRSLRQYLQTLNREFSEMKKECEIKSVPGNPKGFHHRSSISMTASLEPESTVTVDSPQEQEKQRATRVSRLDVKQTWFSHLSKPKLEWPGRLTVGWI